MTIEAERSPIAGAGQPPVPEQGQVVNVRGSNWAVADVRQQGLPRSPADEGTAGLTHVVDLQSLDEERLCVGSGVVRRRALPPTPADEGTAGLTHVVDLQSLDEDRLGEELSVVWELEVGHTVAPDQGLPESISADRFDDPNTL